MSDRDPRKDGIVPFSLLSLKCKYIMFERLAKDDGIVPEKELPSSDR
jgi:hypothetical protein